MVLYHTMRWALSIYCSQQKSVHFRQKPNTAATTFQPTCPGALIVTNNVMAATEKKGFDVRAFFTRHGIIPLDDVCGKEFDLMKAATPRPKPGKGATAATLVPMHGGFTEDFFNYTKLPDGATELAALLSDAGSTPVADLVGLYEGANARSGHGGDGNYSLTDMKVRSMTTSLKLMPFLAKYIHVFASNVPLLSSHFGAKPTVFRGSIDKVVAFIITTLTGKVQRNKESSHEIFGEVQLSAGFSQSASRKDERKERDGVLGAAVCLVHVQKTVRSPQVHIMNHAILQREDDPQFNSFLRRVRLKEFRSLIVGRQNAPLGFFTERESVMAQYGTLDNYVSALLRDAPPLSLSGWDGGRGIVKLVAYDGGGMSHDDSNSLELPEEHRVKGGQNFLKNRFSSGNYLYSASQEELSALYLALKKEGSVEVDGVTVVAMSPAFTAETGNFLPIYHGGLTEQGDVPGSVVRDYDDGTFIFPVEGHEDDKRCVTVYDEHWHVQESIVRVDRSDTNLIEFYQERGFRAVHDPDGEGYPSEIVLGRHRLVLEGEEEVKAEDPVFFSRAPDGCC